MIKAMKGTFIIILIFLYGQSNACDCAKTETVKESFNKYPLIVHGRVIDISVVPFSLTLQEEQLDIIRNRLMSDDRRLSRLESERVKKVTFQIIEIIKGDSISNTVTIFTSINSSCDINFEKKKEYLVYGTRVGLNDNIYIQYANSNIDLTIDNHYWTHFCTRTRLFNEQEKIELSTYKKSN